MSCRLVNTFLKTLKCISDSLETVKEIAKLVKKSPQRNTKLDKIRAETQNESRGVHAFCPTRWTVRGESLEAVLNNYMKLMELWEWSLDICRHRDEGANPWSSRDDDHFSILLWVHLRGVYLEVYLIYLILKCSQTPTE